MIDDVKKRFGSLDLEQLQRLAIVLADHLKRGQVVCLTGDLGAGKTTFAQSLLKAYGVTDYVTSPTYTLMNLYEVKNHALCHMDAYRIKDIEELHELGFYDLLYSSTVLVIEWADIIEEAIPTTAVWIELHYAEQGRDLVLRGLHSEIAGIEEAFERVYTSP